MNRRRLTSSWFAFNRGIFYWSFQINYTKSQTSSNFLKANQKPSASEFSLLRIVNDISIYKSAAKMLWAKREIKQGENCKRGDFFCKTGHWQVNIFSDAWDLLQHLDQDIPPTIKLRMLRMQSLLQQWRYLSISQKDCQIKQWFPSIIPTNCKTE